MRSAADVRLMKFVGCQRILRARVRRVISGDRHSDLVIVRLRGHRQVDAWLRGPFTRVSIESLRPPSCCHARADLPEQQPGEGARNGRRGRAEQKKDGIVRAHNVVELKSQDPRDGLCVEKQMQPATRGASGLLSSSTRERSSSKRCC